jgi:hypothetical protein
LRGRSWAPNDGQLIQPGYPPPQLNEEFVFRFGGQRRPYPQNYRPYQGWNSGNSQLNQNGQWVNGQWVPNNGQFIPNNGQWTPNNGQWAPNNGQLTPNNGQWTPRHHRQWARPASAQWSSDWDDQPAVTVAWGGQRQNTDQTW